MLFPFADYWHLYGFFTLFIIALLALDLGVFHRKAHIVSFKEATAWTAVWVALALIFNVVFYYYALWKFESNPMMLPDGITYAAAAKQVGLEFLTGYVVEKSLAVDNIFIIAVIFSYFAVPPLYQHRVLFYGIIGALVFRAAFIAAGAYIMQYSAAVWIFGGILILTGIKMFFAPEGQSNPGDSIVFKSIKKVFRVQEQFEGQKFFVRRNGLLYATPLAVALIFVEFTDIIFAFDSVPAIFAITKEPLIVYTSNIFAILGLRSMYFMLSGSMNKFAYIKYGLACVLIFVGLKMVYLNDLFGGKFPISWSLLIIVTFIGSSMAYSLYKQKKTEV